MKESTQHFSFWVGLGWVISLNTFSSSIYLPEKFTIFSFLQPNRISSCRCTTFSLFICQLKDIQGVPGFELLWRERQWTWLSECVWGMMLNLLGRCQGVVCLAWINLYHLENFPQCFLEWYQFVVLTEREFPFPAPAGKIMNMFWVFLNIFISSSENPLFRPIAYCLIGPYPFIDLFYDFFTDFVY